ncbi:MAG: DUF2207 family protein [Acidimicrobiales bacterium]
MNRRRQTLVLALTLTVLVIGGMVVVGWRAVQILGDRETRSFSLDSVVVDAELERDGTLVVSELVTYTFRGADDRPFTVGTRDFEPGPFDWSITDIEAFEDGSPRATVLESAYLFEWDIAPATSGTRTFELRYTVEGATQVGSDVVELYWNWVGTISPAIGSWSATVRLPDGDGDVLAWAHGPLDGVLRVDDPVVRSAVDDVPARHFVDNRITVPLARFDLAPGTDELLPGIIAEEEVLARQANDEREAAADRERWLGTARTVLTIGMGPLVVGAVAAFLWVWRRWGKDPPRPTDIGDYWRDVPGDPPAVAAALLAWRQVSSDAYAATVMDLARRGHLRIEEISVPGGLLRRAATDYRLTRTTPTAPDHLADFEERALAWILPHGTHSVTQEELADRARSNQSDATTFWSEFRRLVVADLDRRHYLVRGNGIAFVLHGLIVASLLATSVIALVLGVVIPGLAGLLAALVLLPLGVLHRARTPAGTRRDMEWRGLQRFLRDFSRLDEAPVGHLALWDHYLVAATALGVAEELLEGLRTRFPDLVESGSLGGGWYVSSTAASAGAGAGMASFGRSFGSAAVSSFTPPSSGSGGGGGFSSGGGGGGGGGGFGAR